MASAAKHEVELISFKNPSEARIYIPKITWSGTREELVDVLRLGPIAKHGLIHSIYVERCRHAGDDSNLWFACVEFYSQRSARQARLFCHNNLTINKLPCAVVRSTRKSATDLPLSLRNCEELANHYLGFNGWHSEILYHRLESVKNLDGGLVTMKYCSSVGLSFSCSQYHMVEGAGIAEATFHDNNLEEKSRALSTAQKQSRGTALQNAFAKVILIVVDGDKDKVDVEIDTARLEPFHYDPIWEHHEVIINEVDYSVGQEEDDEVGVEVREEE